MHRALVEQKPQLFAQFQSESSSVPTAYLKSVSLDVGHVLVQWLYSGTYQLWDREPALSTREALETAFAVYSLAKTYQLAGLETLATDQIIELGSAADFVTCVDVITDNYPRIFGKDARLREFIMTRMKTALENGESLVMTVEEGGEAPDSVPVATLLVKSVVDACRATDKEPFVSLSTEPDMPEPGERVKSPVQISTPMPLHELEPVSELPPTSEPELVPGPTWMMWPTKKESGLTVPESQPEPELEAVKEPAVDEECSAPPKKMNKKKKKQKCKAGMARIIDPDPMEELAPEPAQEPQATPLEEPVLEVLEAVPIPEAEPPQEAEVMAEPELVVTLVPEDPPEPVILSDDDFCTTPTATQNSKKKKKKVSRIDCDVPAEEPPAESPEVPIVFESDVEPKNPWEFWGAKKSPKSPRQSLS